MKNKKAFLLQSNIIYLILIGICVVLLFGVFYHYKNGASVWEDFYAKEISRAINMAEPGDLITIDLDKASIIAKRNDYPVYDKLVVFDNSKKEIIVKLGNSGETHFSYFNDVDIVNASVVLGVPTNVLTFRVEKSGGNK